MEATCTSGRVAACRQSADCNWDAHGGPSRQLPESDISAACMDRTGSGGYENELRAAKPDCSVSSLPDCMLKVAHSALRLHSRRGCFLAGGGSASGTLSRELSTFTYTRSLTIQARSRYPSYAAGVRSGCFSAHLPAIVVERTPPPTPLKKPALLFRKGRLPSQPQLAFTPRNQWHGAVALATTPRQHPTPCQASLGPESYAGAS